MTEYVYIKSSADGVFFPTPTTWQPSSPSFSSRLWSFTAQKGGQGYAEFFARREERNAKIIAAAAPRPKKARESSCGRKSMASGLIRSEVEDEWYEFRPSQRSFDPVKNEWDLCKPLDSKADVPDNGEYDDDDDDYMGNWIDPKPPVGPSAPPSAPVSSTPPSNPPSAPPAPAPSTAAPSTTVQSIDDNVHEPVSVSTTLRT
ncbi:hypothetical protein R3P38DRAFT_2795052 [Favolaschia claudopus]|uniref:Uncharacterized protein n=1 Tax=Favolaschia claudopus TaxID=2862362 RepID=A0AAW0A7X7_9AGAR